MANVPAREPSTGLPQATVGDHAAPSAHVGSKRRLSQRDVFTLPTNWTEELGCSTQSLELSSALESMGNVTSHHIAEATRLTYTQVYNQICEYAASLSPPIILDVSKDPIPADIIVSYFRVLFTGADKPVLSGDGQPLMTADGRPRKGRGLSEGTFRKHFFGLKTLHVHFQRKQVYEFNSETMKWEGNPCNDPTVQRVYTGYLKLYHDPTECQKYGRQFDPTPNRAPVFQIRHLLSLYNVCQVKHDAYTMREWTYILLSCALFLRKSEAAALMINDIDVPSNHVTGKVLLEDGLPRFVYVMIRRSKTDQDGQGQQLLLRRNIGNYKLCPVLTLMSWLAILKLKFGLTSGPVFPNLSKSSLGSKLNLESFRKIFKKMMDAADLTSSGFKTHSCRRTAAYYAAWQKVPETTIKLLGRWDSQVYQTYVDSADMDRREWEETCSQSDEDPISTNFNIFGNLLN